MKTLVMILCVVMLGGAVEAGVAPPHSATDGYACSVCHAVHRTLGTGGFNNACLDCHRPGDLKGGAKSFMQADMADLYGNTTTASRGNYATSHKWEGTDDVPQAGAAPPQTDALNATRALGTLACSRCHTIHGEAENRPLLRMNNDRDQLCLDCHRARNLPTHVGGNHPVGVAYGAAVASGKLYSTVRNANPANPTALPKLVEGKVSCSTCHGVHYADSDSTTFDVASSVRNLKRSQGYLLRTDLYGKTANDINICTSCHKKPNHNYRQQNIQCDDCHKAHVASDEAAANSYLVRKYMNVSTATRRVRNTAVYFAYTGAERLFKRADGNGVCQGCHVVPETQEYPSEHQLAEATAAQCMTCHTHDSATGAFSLGGSCANCHGNPPHDNISGGPDGYARDYGVRTGIDERTTRHQLHAGRGSNYSYRCVECHNGYSHNARTYQDVFIDTSGMLAGTGGFAPAYDPTARICAGTYCHSDGNGSEGRIAPAWTGAIEEDCSGCHGGNSTAVTTIASGSHQKHVSKYRCVRCHVATVPAGDDRAITDKTQHVNGTKEVVFETGGAYEPSSKTCSAVSCHGNSPVTWGGNLDCGGCHSLGAVLASGAHAKHVTVLPAFYNFTANRSAGATYQFGCSNCHSQDDSLHANSANNVTLRATNSGTGGQPGLLRRKNAATADGINIAGSGIVRTAGGTVTCTLSYCHSNGRSTGTHYATPEWAVRNGATGCGICHEAAPTTEAHTAHINKGYACAVCHAATVTEAGAVNAAQHVSGVRDVVFGGLAEGTLWAPATATCTNGKCHSGGRDAAAPATVPVWSNPATGQCGQCHPVTPLIAPVNDDTIATGAHAAHLTATYGPRVSFGETIDACRSCHRYAAQQPDGLHVNGNVDLLPTGCINCHPGNTPWQSGRLTCLSCHDTENSVLEGGVAAPEKIMFTTAGHGKPGGAYAASRECTSCHDNGARHITGVLGDDKRLLLPNNNSQCASCHDDAAKVPTATKRGVTSHVTQLDGPADAVCISCHDVHGTVNMAMVRESIGGWSIRFTGPTDFIQAAPPYRGVCQVCHRHTKFYIAGDPNIFHFPDRNCTDCHKHNGDYAFKSAARCDSCHGYPPGDAHGFEGHVRAAAVPEEGYANCAVCHFGGDVTGRGHLHSGLPIQQSDILIRIDERNKLNNGSSPLYTGPLDGSGNVGSCANIDCHFKPSPNWR